VFHEISLLLWFCAFYLHIYAIRSSLVAISSKQAADEKQELVLLQVISHNYEFQYSKLITNIKQAVPHKRQSMMISFRRSAADQIQLRHASGPHAMIYHNDESHVASWSQISSRLFRIKT